MDMIGAYLEHLRRNLSHSGSDATVGRRRDILRLLDRQLPFGLAETTQAELEDWLHGSTYIRNGAEVPWSNDTKATYWRAIHSAFKFWADPRDPWLDSDPTLDMTPVKSKQGTARDITDDELWHILKHARNPVLLWVTIAAYQGLRCIELSGLDREHITEEKLIVVRGKGGKPRTHDTDPMVWQAVSGLPRGPVCRSIRTGDRAGANYITKTAGREFRALGLQDVSMHRLRHWLGVRAQARYKDIRVTQQILGHETLSATQIYTRATVEQQRAARSMLPRPGAAA